MSSPSKKVLHTKVLPCSCKHPYQEQKYGKGRRLHNPLQFTGHEGEREEYRCSVCGTVRQP